MLKDDCFISLKEGNFISLVAPYPVILLISDTGQYVLKIADVPDFYHVNYVILYDPQFSSDDVDQPFLVCLLMSDKYKLIEEETSRYNKYILKPLMLCTTPLFSFPMSFMKSFYSFHKFSDYDFSEPL